MQRNRVMLATILSLLTAAGASAQSPQPRTISVTGSAEIRVVPDEVIVTVGIENNAFAIEAARAENDRRVKAVAQAARDQGVDANHVGTDFLTIEPRYRDNDNRREFLGYFVRRSLSITLRDVSKFEALMSAVLGAGANYIHGVDFRTTRLRQHRDEARRLALVAAREKAAAMAAAFNVPLGEAVSIQEGSSGWWSPYGSWWGSRGGSMMVQNSVQESGGRGAGGDEALVPGQISVSASVSVTFELGRR